MNCIEVAKETKIKFKTLLISSFIWGFLAHGYAFTNELAFHDNAGLFNIGATFESGRWSLGIFSWLLMYITGSDFYTTPLLYGVLNIFFIFIFSFIVVNCLKIRNKALMILINGLLIVYPMVASAFGYMFTAPYYFFGVMLGGVGIYFFNKKETLFSFLLCAFLMSIGIGVYQANLPILVCFLVAILIRKTIEGNGDNLLFVKNVSLYGGVSIASLVLYILIDKIMRIIFSVPVTNYKDVNNYGATSISGYIERMAIAYKEFFNPTNNVSRNMYPFSLIKFYKLFLILLAISLAVLLIRQWKESKNKAVQLLVLTSIIPLCTNLIYVMVSIEMIDGLMTYGQLFIFIYFAMFVESIDYKKDIINRFVLLVAIVFILLFDLSYVRFDNICYLKANHMQSQAFSYFTTLVTQIKSCDGYKNGMNVVYIKPQNKDDSSFSRIEEFDKVYLHPYNVSSIINDYTWKTFMNRWCGFSPTLLEEDEYANLEEVKKMACYPNPGSIKVVNDTLVIKFAD